MAENKFSRFGEKRKIGSDTAGYDEYVEGVEPDETSSLETPLQQDNLGFKLIQRMGWNTGTGLGKFKQGRVDPVPFELKDDHMGLGRWTMELELAQDATEKRRQLEVEKEMSEDLLEQYRQQAVKEKKMVEMLTEMNKAFYCELCDRQYTKYSEYDNHINSYSHHHNQRLRDLKQYETGRRFGAQKSHQEEREKMVAAQMVAIERAQMRWQERRKVKSGVAPGFKPIGGGSAARTAMPASSSKVGQSRTQQATESVAQDLGSKKMKLSKLEQRFQSAGTLMSIGDARIGKDTPIVKETKPTTSSTSGDKKGVEPETMNMGRGKSLEQKKALYTTKKWEKAGTAKAVVAPSESEHVEKAPPPLISRQKELNMAGAEDSSDDEPDFIAKSIIKKPAPKSKSFKLNLPKELR